MMEELRKLPPLSPPEMVLPLKLKKKQPLVKKKTRNLIKVAQVAKLVLMKEMVLLMQLCF
jgi:double-stranded RNA-binding protein Staufen